MGSDFEYNKFCGQVSTNKKVISKKDGDLLSHFDNNNESKIPVLVWSQDSQPQILSTTTPHQKMLINNHTDANKGKFRGI